MAQKRKSKKGLSMDKKEACEWCGKENDDKTTVKIVGVGDFKICSDCMNDYAAEDFDKLSKKLMMNSKLSIKQV